MNARIGLAVLGVWILLTAAGSAVEWTHFEGIAHGFPVMRELNGRRIADGDFVQWLEGNRLHVKITYSAGRGRRIEEQAVFRQRPQLTQDFWSLKEARDGKPYRQFEVDLVSGRARATATDEGEPKEWSETVDVAPGRTFAGFGFTMAIKALRERLVRGEVITLDAVGFMPKPRGGSVEISYAGRDRIRMSDRTIAADHFIVHPKVPAIARLFVKVPDASIWLTTPPAGFLRWEGAMAVPDDPIIRVDLLPGDPSAPAEPVATSGTKPIGTSGKSKR
jgi:hypothetical protein